MPSPTTGVPILVTLMEGGLNSGKIAGAKCIANLACNPELQEEVAKRGGIPPLVGILKASTDMGKESAAGALGNLACNENNKVATAFLSLGPIVQY